MAKESTISKLKWAGVSAIISSIITFISTAFLNYIYNTSTTLKENSNISLYTIPIVLGIAGSVLLVSYYILSRKDKKNEDKWRYFPANTS
jgi:drug/metabolite transporter (DMT)-like permease